MPQQHKELGIRFERRTVAKIKGGTTDMVLLRPAGSLLQEDEAVGPEPRWNLVICGLHLEMGDGTVAEGSGQLLITGQRLIGMIDTGSATGSPPLSLEASGNVFCFTFNRLDVYAPDVKKHRMKPSDFSFRAREELEMSFRFIVFSAMAFVANDKTGLWYDKNMSYALSVEGREGLLKT
jgi:hypothetical protein